MSKAIYPGSFDPVTNGHVDMIRRAASIFDELIVGVLDNRAKTPLFLLDERVKMLEEVCSNYSNVKIISYEGLLVDFAKENKASVIVRGLRGVSDFEYELLMAQTNKELSDGIETVFLPTSLGYSYISSSTVKEVASYGGDIRKFVPEFIAKLTYDKFNMVK